MPADFLPPSKEIIEQVRAEFGLDEESIKEAVDMLKDWLVLQPHLPKVIGKYAATEHFIFTVCHNSSRTPLPACLYHQFTCNWFVLTWICLTRGHHI
jgi:hypothetical protein